MTLVHRLTRNWEPWSEFGRLQGEVNRLFADFFEPAAGGRVDRRPIRVWQNEGGVAVTLEAPGFKTGDFDVSVLGDTVTVQANRVPEKPTEGAAYQRRERTTEPLVRTIQLPFEVDAEKTVATYEKGVLSLSLFRAEKDLPAKIAVNAG